jgi:hypothetical protein
VRCGSTQKINCREELEWQPRRLVGQEYHTPWPDLDRPPILCQYAAMLSNDSFVGSHRSRAQFIAAILLMVSAAVNLAVGVSEHKKMLLIAGVLAFVGVVLLFRSARRRPS